MPAERDPRAWWLDDDPFDKKKSQETNNNTRTNNSTFAPEQNPFQDILNDCFYLKRYTIPIHKGSMAFSKIEIQHLTQATLAFTLALAFIKVGNIRSDEQSKYFHIFGCATFYFINSCIFIT